MWGYETLHHLGGFPLSSTGSTRSNVPFGALSENSLTGDSAIPRRTVSSLRCNYLYPDLALYK